MEAMRPAALDAFGGGYDGTSAPPTKHWVPVSGRLVRGGFCDGQGWRGRGLGRQPIPLGRAKQSCRVLILDSNAPRPLGSCWFLANRAREAGGKTLRLQATPDTAKPSRQDKLAQPKGGGSSGSGGGGEEEVWGFFSPAEFSASWDVPWGFGTVIFGSILWLVSFICVGLIVLPLTAGLLGFDLSDTAVMEKSEIILLNQATPPSLLLPAQRSLWTNPMGLLPDALQNNCRFLRLRSGLAPSPSLLASTNFQTTL